MLYEETKKDENQGKGHYFYHQKFDGGLKRASSKYWQGKNPDYKDENR